MSDDSSPPPEPGSPPPTDAVNDQIRDAVRQISGLLEGQTAPFADAVACQTLAHAVALGMHNAVAQQQQAHILRSALTAAAARALLEGKTAEAEAVLKLAESPLVNPNVAEELARLQATLRATMDELKKTFGGARPSPPPPPPSSAAAS